MTSLYCYDNEIIKWENDGVNYCLHILADDGEECNPRDYDHDSIMACFYGRYRLGDAIDSNTSEEFWNNLVWKYCDDKEVFDALVNRKLFDTCAIQYHDLDDDNDYWAICTNNSESDDWIPNEEEYSWKSLFYDDLVQYSRGEFSIRDCMKLLEKKVVWLPLWIYEHSGITMSCGERTYPYNDMFDSSCAGWIVTVLSDFNEQNKAIAEQNMKLEVKEYDNYLTGEVYWYTLYEQDGFVEDDVEESAEPNWVEIDSCGGFFGDDPIQNGMAYNAGNGLEEAIENGSYEKGEAERIVTTSWRF